MKTFVAAFALLATTIPLIAAAPTTTSSIPTTEIDLTCTADADCGWIPTVGACGSPSDKNLRCGNVNSASNKAFYKTNSKRGEGEMVSTCDEPMIELFVAVGDCGCYQGQSGKQCAKKPEAGETTK